MYPTCNFKTIDFAAEVSQKYTLQESLKMHYSIHRYVTLTLLQYGLSKTSYKIYVILHISLRRPPNGLT